MTECAGAVGTLADKRSKVPRRDENLLKKSKCQTLRRSAIRDDRFVLRLFVLGEWKTGTLLPDNIYITLEM